MNLVNIDGHTINRDILRAGGTVVDVGCRGFIFPIYCLGAGCEVLAFDPDPSIIPPVIQGLEFRQAAIVGTDETSEEYCRYSTGEGNYLTKYANAPELAEIIRVPCLRLKDVFEAQWNTVKLDCEGAEYDILLNWPGPIALQISVEFHDFLGMNPDSDNYYNRMLANLGQWYRVVQHKQTPGPSGIVNYWDSLFVLK